MGDQYPLLLVLELPTAALYERQHIIFPIAGRYEHQVSLRRHKWFSG
jgi:hypothetical protein